MLASPSGRVYAREPSEKDWDWRFWRENIHRTSLALGFRVIQHYMPERTINTPPFALLREAQFTFLPTRYIGTRAFFGTTVSGDTKEGGVGFDFFLARITDHYTRCAVFCSLALVANSELAYYTTAPPVAPWLYEESGIQFRYGGSLLFGFHENDITIVSSFLITRFSDNWLITPFVGLSIGF